MNPPVSYDAVVANDKVQTWIRKANEQMSTIGYTEHGHRHAKIVAKRARAVCLETGHDARTAELAAIAGYVHDIGCMVHRAMHPQIGASIVLRILDEMHMDPAEVGDVVAAVANHEESDGTPVSALSAALILADKSDVHFSRVQNPDRATFDVHDRVNDAVRESVLVITPRNGDGDFLEVASRYSIKLRLAIDTEKASVTDYFEIFLARMIMSKRAARVLNAEFHLEVNGFQL
jgi:metal-dependent HD superfamily phosphatase/phosphodiesterase